MHSFGGSGAEQATLADQDLSTTEYTHTRAYLVQSLYEAKSTQLQTCRHTEATLEAENHTHMY